MFLFFILVTLVFIIIGVFFPEWVGITGKKAHEIQKHQQEEISTEEIASSKKDPTN